MQQTSSPDQPHILVACHDCDLLLEFKRAKPKHAVHCPRCNFLLHEHKPNSINNTLALAITGLILFLPATLLPIMSMSLFDTLTHDTVLRGVERLYETGHIGVSILIMLCSIVFPLLRLLLAILIIIPIKLHRARSAHIAMFKIFQHLSSWTMLEVYMVGILVAIIKMADIASVEPGVGMFCFIGLMFSSIGLSLVLDKHQIWEQLEAQAHG